MASRYHWLTAGGNQAWSAAQTFANYPLSIPPNARLVRILAKEVGITGQATKINWPGPGPVFCTLTAALSGGSYNKTIYSRTGHVHQTLVGLYDFVTTERVYSANYSGQDDTLGFNHECSYGGVGKFPGTLTFSWQMLGNPNVVPPAAGQLQIVFMALYYL